MILRVFLKCSLLQTQQHYIYQPNQINLFFTQTVIPKIEQSINYAEAIRCDFAYLLDVHHLFIPMEMSYFYDESGSLRQNEFIFDGN